MSDVESEGYPIKWGGLVLNPYSWKSTKRWELTKDPAVGHVFVFSSDDETFTATIGGATAYGNSADNALDNALESYRKILDVQHEKLQLKRNWCVDRWLNSETTSDGDVQR